MSADCVHHYLIATTDGPTSLGVCKLCGAEKMHSNYIDVGFAGSFKQTPTEQFRWHYGQNRDTYILSGDQLEE
jgi:hypothetical protein